MGRIFVVLLIFMTLFGCSKTGLYLPNKNLSQTDEDLSEIQANFDRYEIHPRGG
jgi:predicted small lipoprotein YifL